MKRVLVAAAAAAAVLVALVPADAAERLDYAGFARNVLPPGQSGSLGFPRTATDQLALYDGLTPKGGDVSAADLVRFFKSARFGPDGRAVRTVRPKRGLRIVRDRWDVPHVYGATRDDVMFGAGWVTAEDRGLLMNLLRGPGRVAALDVPGLDAFRLATTATAFTPTAATEARLAAQAQLLERVGPRGLRVLRDIDRYVAGINAYNRAAGYSITPWTRNDVAAVAAIIGAVFGVGGGDETRSAQLLSALQGRLGADRGVAVWNDLRALDDPESPVSVPRRTPYGTGSDRSGNVVVDDGSFEPLLPGAAVPAPRRSMSNALLLARSRSATGRPLFVAGPQVGHSFPQIMLELDLHGGGIDARGAAFPGVSMYALIGRGRDFAWSATSANLDLVDTYAETLCGGDDLHYLWRGECRAMTTFEAGTVQGRDGQPDRRVVLRETVHGPVAGYATVGGRRVAITRRRSTRGREVLAALVFADLNANVPRSARGFLRVASGLELTFNLVYADDRDVAQLSTGRLPLRAPGVDGGLPTVGDGSREWRGWLPAARHAQVVNPGGGALLNWNNRPAPGFAAGDDGWSWGSVQRVELLQRGIASRRRHTLASVVAAMNRAATQDLRVVEVWPLIRDVLATGPAPSERARQAAARVDAWREAGASRLDGDLDGRIDSPGAAVMDAAWSRLADAVLAPVLGPLVDRLAALEPRDDRPGPDGNAYGGGWYGYVDKDLRTLLGRPVRGPYATRYCGAGELAACRASLWAALDAAAAELEAAQGSSPDAWRADATRERIDYGFLPRSMRFANRPTFQQVMSFAGHRPRP
ncbi:MAG TPA: penicillin acylase family protein [Gaiellaceae bacterium]|nr:penicillin acylase family protein [Gaiellaceae bacterium]